jgi:hypothetical protein
MIAAIISLLRYFNTVLALHRLTLLKKSLAGNWKAHPSIQDLPRSPQYNYYGVVRQVVVSGVDSLQSAIRALTGSVRRRVFCNRRPGLRLESVW